MQEVDCLDSPFLLVIYPCIISANFLKHVVVFIHHLLIHFFRTHLFSNCAKHCWIQFFRVWKWAVCFSLSVESLLIQPAPVPREGQAVPGSGKTERSKSALCLWRPQLRGTSHYAKNWTFSSLLSLPLVPLSSPAHSNQYSVWFLKIILSFLAFLTFANMIEDVFNCFPQWQQKLFALRKKDELDLYIT